MPRGKNTNVYLNCQNKRSSGTTAATATKGDDKKGDKKKVEAKKCGMQNYKTRINKKTSTKLEHKKFCPKCNTSTMHASGSEIKHSSS